eukprot:CAMPEP_0202963030 /NCGR_PEP_ID=MMETSP1396-20130829/7032_1 /ASSEMBLY_ACC=CAM_ASM_000872 /TAXON_ID= /ORGANISM="Pseudokeronopsis sp., Strain Brazil" /LENGTH=333 /DNA_ID=CAMNT_0049683935 /DNA_START=39 /DNA_END=1040 /DNA_ORIENTATION=-
MLARRLFSPAVRNIARATKVSARSMSTILEGKERAEETRYIKAMEAARDAELRQNLEKILALEDGHEKKQELQELLAGTEEKKSGLALLTDWKIAVPLGILVGIPGIMNDVIMIDAETMLAATFALFCSTVYTQLGPVISRHFDEQRQVAAKKFDGLEKVFTHQAERLIAHNEIRLDAVELYKEHNELIDDMATVEAQMRNTRAEYEYRDAYMQKLDALHVLEENAVAAIRSRTISTVKNEVVQLFTHDKKAKENALNAAIAVLSQGEGGKRGKDVVGEAFSAALASYKEKALSSDDKKDPILTKLEKDVEALICAPELYFQNDTKNVHPFAP